MALVVKMLTLGMISTNCFVLGDDESKDAVVIDPADDADAIMEVVEQEDWTVRKILATHAHFDHILAAGDLKKRTDAPFILHRDDLPILKSMPESVRALSGLEVAPAPDPDEFVSEGDVVQVGAIRLDVIFTPGHAPGHVSYLTDANLVFSGDCLFAGSIGRTDLFGGDYEVLMATITEKLMSLDDSIQVASGHGPLTTIGRERASNPFILEWQAKRAHNVDR